jgi:hypothetical protein
MNNKYVKIWWKAEIRRFLYFLAIHHDTRIDTYVAGAHTGDQRIHSFLFCWTMTEQGWKLSLHIKSYDENQTTTACNKIGQAVATIWMYSRLGMSSSQ